MPVIKSCENCRWAGCKNYGKELNVCGNYIMLSEEEKRIPRFVYTENGEMKSSLDEHERRVEILEHNQRLQREYPV